MATQPKPKPKPEPEPPEPGEDATTSPVIEESQVALIERVDKLEDRMTKLEERVAAPPVGLGRRP